MSAKTAMNEGIRDAPQVVSQGYCCPWRCVSSIMPMIDAKLIVLRAIWVSPVNENRSFAINPPLVKRLCEVGGDHDHLQIRVSITNKH